MWTNCGKDSIVGASVAFIDTTWRFRFIPLLATVKNDGHNAPQVIESGFQAKYDVDIRSMARFTMSDTTHSSRNVVDHIDTEQEDCSMHLLDLCIGTARSKGQYSNEQRLECCLSLVGQSSNHCNFWWISRGRWRCHSEAKKSQHVLQWFRDEGQHKFPSIALLARIHLGKISSSAFQERVFSTGGIVMGLLRTRTDNRRSEKQLLLRHNTEEIVRMKRDARKAREEREASKLTE